MSDTEPQLRSAPQTLPHANLNHDRHHKQKTQGKLFAKVCNDFCAFRPVRDWLLGRKPLVTIDEACLGEAYTFICTFRKLLPHSADTCANIEESCRSDDAEILVPHAVVGNFILATIHGPSPTHRLAEATAAESPLGMSVTIKTRRMVLLQGEPDATVALEFCWMHDESLLGYVKLIRSSRDPAVPTSSLECAEYTFFRHVRKNELPANPFRVLTVSKVSTPRRKRRLQVAQPPPRDETPQLVSVKCKAGELINSIEPNSVFRVVYAETRNMSLPGLPPKWKQMSIELPMFFSNSFCTASRGQRLMLQHLVLARITQSAPLLSRTNQFLSARNFDATCSRAWGAGTVLLEHDWLSHISDNDESGATDACSSSYGEILGEEEDLIDAPFIGVELPPVRDFQYAAPDSRVNTILPPIPEFSISSGIMPVAWCYECQDYTLLTMCPPGSFPDEHTLAMRPRCADCGAGFSMRAVLSRHFRAADILAACHKNTPSPAKVRTDPGPVPGDVRLAVASRHELSPHLVGE